MWLHSVARRARRSTRAYTRSPSCSSPFSGCEHERLVVAEPDDVDHLRAAAAVLALDHARVVHLAAAGRVERGLDELREHAAVLVDHRRDRGRLLGRLVAGEDRRRARRGRERRAASRARPRCPRGPRWRERGRAAPPSGTRSPARRRRRPCSAASSSVRSNGKPNVSCSRNASSAPMPSAPCSRARSITSSSIRRPCSSVRLNVSSSVRSHMSIVSRLLEQLGVGGAHRLAHDLRVARQEARARCRSGGPGRSRAASAGAARSRGPRWRARCRRRSGTTSRACGRRARAARGRAEVVAVARAGELLAERDQRR